MKIRIIDPGFAGFNGHLGTAFFVDGVCDDVSASEAERMASIVAIEEVDTGLNPSVTQRMVDLVNKNADEMGINSNEVLVRSSTAPVVQPTAPHEVTAEQAPVVNEQPKGLSYDYTKEDLAALADREGIAGIRAFASQYNINGRSLNGIIQELMDLKAVHNKPARAEVVEQPVVEEPVIEQPEVEDDLEEEVELVEDEPVVETPVVEDDLEDKE
ncbi:hypothetical protein CNR34_00017 [Pseudomonas phage nickie]|uniref:Uncharacterized protein n=1 Tax=Pseudomonas phage nickie TaxID=2048977 RepID=A0A2H4P7D9_9CAUD|nr:hypothetical protein FDJ16_gp148 [Pseudomonas phage nickie]ATW57950.1 hypothetical protein CNR34_00017 [Pseudomonas phage nickie]